MSEETRVSKCCGAPAVFIERLEVIGHPGASHYWECGRCLKPCDVHSAQGGEGER